MWVRLPLLPLISVSKPPVCNPEETERLETAIREDKPMGAGRRLENGSECMLVGVRLPLFPPERFGDKAGRISWVIW